MLKISMDFEYLLLIFQEHRISFCVCFFVSESSTGERSFSSDNTTAWAVYTDPSSRTLKSGSLDWMWSTDPEHSFKLTASKKFSSCKVRNTCKRGWGNVLIMYTIFFKTLKWNEMNRNQPSFSKYFSQLLYTYFKSDHSSSVKNDNSGLHICFK